LQLDKHIIECYYATNPLTVSLSSHLEKAYVTNEGIINEISFPVKATVRYEGLLASADN
jgi:hypothetical protein